MNKLTVKEISTVKTLILLGDAMELAIQTVIADREAQKMKREQHNFYCKYIEV